MFYKLTGKIRHSIVYWTYATLPTPTNPPQKIPHSIYSHPAKDVRILHHKSGSFVKGKRFDNLIKKFGSGGRPLLQLKPRKLKCLLFLNDTLPVFIMHGDLVV